MGFRSLNEPDQSRAVVLLHDMSDAKKESETEQDLNVMSHILKKASASRDERNARSIGISFHSPFGGSFGGSSSSPNLYVEGHGAIFFLNVNYSLTPPPSKPDVAEAKAKPERDSEWDKAERELAHPRGGYTEGAE